MSLQLPTPETRVKDAVNLFALLHAKSQARAFEKTVVNEPDMPEDEVRQEMM
jgi:hypothetical protein